MFFSLFLVLFMVLIAVWVLGWLAFHVAGGLIHIVLIVAVISLIVHFARAARRVAPSRVTRPGRSSDLEGKAMAKQPRTELAIPDHGLVQRTKDALLELISRVPASSEDRVVDAATRARTLTTTAALKAATISGSLALPPGPLGLVTVLPDLYAVWRVQAQLVSDIAAVYGQTAFLSQESMAWCLFRHAAAQAVRDVVTRVGERAVVNGLSLRAMETVLARIGVTTTQRVLQKGAARFIPVVGALGVAAYAYYDTGQVGHAAIDLFGTEISTVDVP